MSIEQRQGLKSLCSAERGERNGGAAQPTCMWAMDDASVKTLREVWTQAQEAEPMKPVHSDDDTHLWRPDLPDSTVH